MKHQRWRIIFGFGLVSLSALLYFFHCLCFKDVHHIFICLAGDRTELLYSMSPFVLFVPLVPFPPKTDLLTSRREHSMLVS